MKTKLHQRVLETIRRHQMFSPGDRVGVAVSGGADSLALLLLLEDLRAELGIQLLVVHFNHQLRGAESDADEKFVAEQARSRGLEFVPAREDVAGYAQREHVNLEEAARQLRYDFFTRVVQSGHATRVAVAHTVNDQAETLLAHLLRGTGLTGLAGIYPVVGQVVRPLLEVRRQELRGFLSARQQPWREDQTNLDTTRMRSRIRHELLPLLERDFQPATVARLAELAALARTEEAFWSALLADRFHALIIQTSAGLEIRIADLLAPLPVIPGTPPTSAANPFEALTRRLIRRIVEELKGDRRQLSAVHVAEVIHLATASTSGHRVELPAGVLVERNFDRLVFSLRAPGRAALRAAETPQAAAAYEYIVELPVQGATTVTVPEIGKRFCLKVIDWPQGASDTSGTADALDRDSLRPPFVLRNWRPGDAYRPRGHRRSQKLKRLFLEGRISRQERARWPVLTSAGRLAWVRALPVADEFAVRPETKIGVLILEETL